MSPLSATLIAALLTSLTAIMTLVVKAYMVKSKAQRDAELKSLESQIKAHADLDDQRFKTIEEMLREMRADIKTLLANQPARRKR